MDLSPYVESLQRDLTNAAAPGGPDIAHAAQVLGTSLESSARLTMLEVLSDAAAEITAALRTGSVEIRLHGRDADIVVTEDTEPADAVPPMPSGAPAATETGDVARITLRLPEALKEQVEAAAASAGVSVNTWLVRAAAGALSAAPGTPTAPGAGWAGPPPPPPPPGRRPRRITGYAEA
jgi:hypothetical protein